MLKTFDWKLESELGHLTGSISRNKTLPEEGLESQGLDIVNRPRNVCLWVSSVKRRIWVTTFYNRPLQNGKNQFMHGDLLEFLRFFLSQGFQKSA